MAHRSGDDDTDQDGSTTRSFFRSDRFFIMNGEWFFTTREGEQGPFRTRKEAEHQLGRFLTERSELDHFQRSREGGPVLRLEAKPHSHKLEMVPLDGEVLI